MLLLAAAHHTGLLSALDEAVLNTQEVSSSSHPNAVNFAQRLSHSRTTTRLRQLATLLFLPVAELHRLWDLRSYTGKLLALLSERTEHAYSYRHTERFLSEIANCDADQSLTAALARWTTCLWQPNRQTDTKFSSPSALNLNLSSGSVDVFPNLNQAGETVFYIDAHHKPVYSDKLVPQGLVGKLGKVLGCRGLTFLHDAWGHPLLVITGRGDTHLTVGLPQVVKQYEQALTPLATAPHPCPENSRSNSARSCQSQREVSEIVADREIMGANFLATQLKQGRSLITLLDANQYKGLESFEEVSEFQPLQYDRQGALVREVAYAKFALNLGQTQPAQDLKLKVALIRDYRHLIPITTPAVPKPDPLLPPNPAAAIVTRPGSCAWWESAEWEAAPTPKDPVQPKLIPIVTSGERCDPRELVELYRRRWQCQENVFKDWLLPLGLDTNHGYATSVVPNSTIQKQREKLTQKLDRLKEHTLKTRERGKRASELHQKYWRQAKQAYQELDKKSFKWQEELENQGLSRAELKIQLAERMANDLARCRRLKRLHNDNYSLSNVEDQKLATQCAQQSQLLRELEDLSLRERPMVELDNRKDQIMSVLKVALANLGMWVRDQYFGVKYAQSVWRTLLPFFKLGGCIKETETTVEVVLEGFNERGLNRDLAVICEKLAAAPMQLPSGRVLKLEMKKPSSKNVQAKLAHRLAG